MARYLVEGGRIVLVLTRDEARGLMRLAAASIAVIDEPDGGTGIDQPPIFRRTEIRKRQGAKRAYAALCSACGPPIA